MVAPSRPTKIEAFVAARKRFVTFVEEKFSLRFHMWLILVATILSGVLSSRLLLLLHVTNMGVRYPIAVLFSYGVFFLFIKMWFVYVIEANQADHQISYVTGANPVLKAQEEIIIVDEAVDAISSAGDPGGLAAIAEKALEKAREEEKAAKASGKNAGGRSGGESSGVGDIAGASLDFVDIASGGDGCAVGLLGIAAVGLLLGVIYFGGFWLIFEAPAVLSEALFQFLLAGSLMRRMRRMEGPTWMGGVFGLTWKPFLIVGVLACATGLWAHDKCPVAVRWAEAWNCNHSQLQHDQALMNTAPQTAPVTAEKPSSGQTDSPKRNSGR